MSSKQPPEDKPASTPIAGRTDQGIEFETSDQDIVKTQNRYVPCGKCTACCQADAIFLYPQDGDDISLYKTEAHESGKLMLAHQYNKDCFYLDRKKGCTIHDYRPIVCREMDCALVLLEDSRIYTKMASPAVIRAGKKRIKMLRERVKRRSRLEKLYKNKKK